MTIGEAIKAVQAIKQSPMPREQLVRWLEEVDLTIMRELVRTHGFGPTKIFDGYDPDDETGADEALLLAPKPYDRMYVYFLCAQIDLHNQEFDLYQNNAALYNAAYNDYAAYYNRMIHPTRKHRMRAWGTLPPQGGVYKGPLDLAGCGAWTIGPCAPGCADGCGDGCADDSADGTQDCGCADGCTDGCVSAEGDVSGCGAGYASHWLWKNCQCLYWINGVPTVKCGPACECCAAKEQCDARKMSLA